MKTIDQLYIPLLSSVGLTISESHHVFSDVEMKKPWTVAGLPVLLPTRDNTREMVEDGVYFHPLSEDFFIGGQSNVLKRLKRTIGAALERRMFALSMELSIIACDIKNHEKLSPKQQGLLNGLKLISANHQKAFGRWLRSLEPNPNGGVLLTLFLKENICVEGHKYKRGAQVTFERVQELVKLADNGQALDKFSKAETATIAGVLSYIIQPWREEYKQEFGSDSSVAPYFAALLEAYDVIMTRLNYLHALFYDLTTPTYRLGNADPKEIASTQWTPANEWAKIFREIPPLPYNRGAEDRENAPESASVAQTMDSLDRDTIKAKQAPVAAQAPVQQPATQPKQGALTDNKGGVKIVEFAQLPGSQIPQYDQWGNPVNVTNATFYQQPAPVQQFAAPQQFAPVQQFAPAPVQQQQRFVDAYGRIVDANGNVLMVPAGQPTAGFVQQPQQPQNVFAAGPFAPAAPANGFGNNQFGGFGGNNGGFNFV